MTEPKFRLLARVHGNEPYWTFLAVGPSTLPERILVRKWCRDQFGEKTIPNGGDWTDIYKRYTSLQRWRIFFKQDNHAFAFRMRWC